MRILQGSYGVFWRMPGHKQQFHADLPATGSPRVAVEWFRELFPNDIICSVRDNRGRFLSFR